MLKKFSVENDALYKNKITLDFTNVREDIERHPEMVKNGVVEKSLFYDNTVPLGSIFGQVLFDIVGRLTDDGTSFFCGLQEYDQEDIKLEYLFTFDDVDVEYKYTRTGFLLTNEILIIDGQEIVNTEKGGVYNEYLQVPTEELKKNISWVKFIGENIDPELSKINAAYKEFMTFVSRMLYFDNMSLFKYIGMTSGFQDVVGYFCDETKLDYLVDFFRSIGLDYDLEIREDKGLKILWDKAAGPFAETASSGTSRLMTLYYWLMFIKDRGGCSFFFINGFDCFLHHSLSSVLYDMLKHMDSQVMIHFMTNTSLASYYKSRPDTCFILQKGKMITLDELTDYKLKTVHNVEKVFRNKILNIF